MDRKAREALFGELQPLAQVTEGKPDPHENLTDLLELMAVAEGGRPAHLQGQGQRDADRISWVQRIAARHGLRTMTTKPVLPFRHRPPSIAQVIIDMDRDTDLRRQQEGHDVLWVFSDERVGAEIPEIVAGRAPISRALGYPDCCVIDDAERKLLIQEAYVRGIIDTFHPATDEETARLWKDDVTVPIAVDPDGDIPLIRDSLRKYPYGQLIACRACLRDIAGSPAARLNREMRNLAFDLSPIFGRRIWETRDLVVNKRPVAYGRNDLCPCGSGAKYKRCCLLVK
jgi:hypothetical protein